MKLSEMTPDERSLLIYFETRMVDGLGYVESVRMNAGDFAIAKRWPEPRRLEPIRVCSQGSWVQRLGGKSERTKELRSMTPDGFARAFALANP